jgi:hypothetical protein
MHTRFEKRFGNEFFRRIPDEPGIFWMSDSRRRLLLLDSTTNLRNKLLLIKNYLSHSHSDAQITSLIQEINWCTYPDPDSAKLAQVKLLEDFHPHYSLDATDTENFAFIAFTNKAHSVEFSLLKTTTSKYQNEYGSFRGRLQTHLFFSSLLRWLRFLHMGGTAMLWPSPFNKNLMPNKMSLSFKFDSNLVVEIHNFLIGDSKDLLLHMAEHIEPLSDKIDLFTRLWLHQDLERLSRFFHTNILKNKQITKLLKIDSDFVPSEWNMPIKIKMNPQPINTQELHKIPLTI